MTKDQVLQTVAETIRETFGVDDIEINRDTQAGDIPGWDSLSHTVLMMTIEQVFGIELASSTSYQNVGDLVDVIEGII